LIFLSVLALLSGGMYVWINSSFSDNFVEQVRGQVGQIDNTDLSVQQTDTANAAAIIAVNKFRDILLIFDIVALICVPFAAYFLTRRTLRPLKLSQDKQQQFIANASHELRTPLAVISGELELALRKTRSIGEYRKTLTHSKQEVDHMNQLTTELLLLAQLDAMDDKAPETTVINLHELIHTMNKSMTALSQEKSVHVHVICPEKVSITGNSKLIGIALSNVIHNAIKYSPDGGNVDITVRRLAKNHANIAIRNQGSSIDTMHQSQLFDRFYQIKSDHNSQGFGLGLAIVKEIITLHRGKIGITSSNQGTTFNITI
jgi:signal transduction histidine kinase